MNRNLLYIASAATLVLALSACTKEPVVQEYTVGEADNEILFSAGIGTGLPTTKAGTALADYYAFKSGTQIRMRVDGNWTGHGTDPYLISQTTTCKTAEDATGDATSEYAATAADNINNLSFGDGEVLYWDDYGTGDPNNTANRNNGLNIYAFAVDGLTTAPSLQSGDTWESIKWPLETSGSNVLARDILCSNNLSDGKTPGRYTFANRKDNEKRRLDFNHVMSKITFQIIAGVGFTSGTIGSTTNKFKQEPVVHLTNDTSWQSGLTSYTNNYCYTTGTVSVTGCSATPATTTSAVSLEKTTDVDGVTRVMHALVYPGTALGGSDDNTVIALVNADDNVYKVSAKEIRAAMNTAHSGVYTTKAGYNYIIKITVNKAGLKVTAAVTDWTSVEVAADAKLNISADKYGADVTEKWAGAFDLYMKESTATSYDIHDEVTFNESNQLYSTSLYWPTTQKTYNLRGFIDPVSGKPSLKTGDTFYIFSSTAYAVTLNRGSASNDYQWGTTFNGTDYGADIIPTSGNVRLQFKHVMSQITVIVQTTTGTDKVDLKGSNCKITGLNNTANVNLNTGDVTLPGSGNQSDYQVYSLAAGNSPEDAGYTSIQIPQAAFTSTDGIKFVITLADGTTYELPLSDSALTTGPNKITAWEQGGSYKYTLTLKKQAINVTAELKDWNTLQTAGGNIQL